MEHATLQNVDRDGTVEEVLDELRDLEDRKLDLVIQEHRHVEPVVFLHGDADRTWEGRVRIDAPELVDQGHEQVFAPTRFAHGQIAEKAGIPRRYYDRMLAEQPHLWRENVATWWRQGKAQRLVRSYRPSNGGAGTMRAWLSDSFMLLDSLPFIAAVLEAVEAEHAGAFRVAAAHLNERRVHVKLVTDRRRDARVGETIQQGITFSNSEVGSGKVKVVPFAVVLSCSNGMVSTQHYDRVHLGGELDPGILQGDTIQARAEAVWKEVRDFTRAALDPEHLGRFVDLVDRAAGVEVQEDPRVAVGNVIRAEARDASSEEATAILDRYLRDAHRNGESQWGIVQAVTREAQEAVDADRQVEMEELGGRLLEMEAERFRGLVGRPLRKRDLERTFGSN